MDVRQWYLRRGRTTRRTWWLHYTLPLGLLAILADLADEALGYPGTTLVGDPDTLHVLTGGPLSSVVALAFLVPAVSSTVTRMHDRGHSAWWLLLGVVPVVGPLVLLVQIGFLHSDAGPNRYGPPERRYGPDPVRAPAPPTSPPAAGRARRHRDHGRR